MHVIVEDLFKLENTKEYILSIQVSLGGFSFSIISEENQLLAYKHTPLTITNQHFLPRRFQEWIENENLLKNQFRDVHFIFHTREFVPVPDKYFEESEKDKLMESLFEIEGETETVVNKIANRDLSLLFTLPKLLKKKLSEHFSESKIVHPLKNCLENIPHINSEGRNGLILLFSAKYFYLILFTEQKLLVVNSFNISHTNDIIFYSLSTLKQFQFSPKQTEVFLAGDILEDEETIQEIKKYFTLTQFLKPAGKIHINTEKFSEPKYRLYNLLNSI